MTQPNPDQPRTFTLLHGHTTAQSAYVVDDYPYGFRLRCKIRYWLEFKRGHGTRLMSQTTNPKKAPAEVWNTPNGSTYAVGLPVMYLNEQGHVTWSCLREYNPVVAAVDFFERFHHQFGVTDREKFAAFIPRVVAQDREAWNQWKVDHHDHPLRPIAFPEPDALPAPDPTEGRTIWNSDGTQGPCLICPPPANENA